jgi:protein-tyrosine-phosphatase
MKEMPTATLPADSEYVYEPDSDTWIVQKKSGNRALSKKESSLNILSRLEEIHASVLKQAVQEQDVVDFYLLSLLPPDYLAGDEIGTEHYDALSIFKSIILSLREEYITRGMQELKDEAETTRWVKAIPEVDMPEQLKPYYKYHEGPLPRQHQDYGDEEENDYEDYDYTCYGCGTGLSEDEAFSFEDELYCEDCHSEAVERSIQENVAYCKTHNVFVTDVEDLKGYLHGYKFDDWDKHHGEGHEVVRFNAGQPIWKEVQENAKKQLQLQFEERKKRRQQKQLPTSMAFPEASLKQAGEGRYVGEDKGWWQAPGSFDNYTSSDFYKIFKLAPWKSMYGGPLWAEVARTINEMEHTTDWQRLMVLIDHFHDLGHNTGKLLDKFPEWHKWFKKLLDEKAKKNSLRYLLQRASGPVKNLVTDYLRTHGKTWVEEGDEEEAETWKVGDDAMYEGKLVSIVRADPDSNIVEVKYADGGKDFAYRRELEEVPMYVSSKTLQLLKLSKKDKIAYTTIHNVLIVCSGNTCRSPMAENILRSIRPDLNVVSRGLYVSQGGPMSPPAEEALKEKGIPFQPHLSKEVTASDVNMADLILTMEQWQKEDLIDLFPQARSKTFLLGDQEIKDPVGGTAEEYKKIRDEIAQALSKMGSLDKFSKGGYGEEAICPICGEWKPTKYSPAELREIDWACNDCLRKHPTEIQELEQMEEMGEPAPTIPEERGSKEISTTDPEYKWLLRLVNLVTKAGVPAQEIKTLSQAHPFVTIDDAGDLAAQIWTLATEKYNIPREWLIKKLPERKASLNKKSKMLEVSPYGGGPDFPVFINPTEHEALQLLNKSLDGTLRYMFDINGDYYVWDAYYATHDQVMEELGRLGYAVPHDSDTGLLRDREEVLSVFGSLSKKAYDGGYPTEEDATYFGWGPYGTTAYEPAKHDSQTGLREGDNGEPIVICPKCKSNDLTKEGGKATCNACGTNFYPKPDRGSDNPTVNDYSQNYFWGPNDLGRSHQNQPGANGWLPAGQEDADGPSPNVMMSSLEKKAYSEYWIDPNGKVYPQDSETHADWVAEHVALFEDEYGFTVNPKWDSQPLIQALIHKEWTRVTKPQFINAQFLLHVNNFNNLDRLNDFVAEHFDPSSKLPIAVSTDRGREVLITDPFPSLQKAVHEAKRQPTMSSFKSFMHKQSVLNKTAKVLKLELYGGRVEVPVLVNPTRNEILGLLKRSIGENGIRVVRGDNVYMWDGYFADHEGVMNQLANLGYEDYAQLETDYLFGEADIDEFLHKVHASLNKVAHCGPCSVLKMEALHILIDLYYKDDSLFPEEVIGELSVSATELKVDNFNDILESVITEYLEEKAEEVGEKLPKLKNLLIALKDIAPKLGKEITVVDKQAMLKQASLEKYWLAPDGQEYDMSFGAEHVDWLKHNADMLEEKYGIKFPVGEKGQLLAWDLYYKLIDEYGWSRVWREGDYGEFGIQVPDIKSVPSYVANFVNKHVRLGDKVYIGDDKIEKLVEITNWGGNLQKEINDALQAERFLVNASLKQAAKEEYPKISKPKSGYVDNGIGYTCGRCEYFNPEREKCKKVEGTIKSFGCCNFWDGEGKFKEKNKTAEKKALETDKRALTKEEAVYVQYPNVDYRCDECAFFNAKAKTCTKVDGEISPTASCNFWQPIKSKQANLNKQANPPSRFWIAPDGKEFEVAGIHWGWIKNNLNILKQYGVSFEGIPSTSEGPSPAELSSRLIDDYGWVRISDEPAGTGFQIEVKDTTNIPSFVDEFISKYFKPGDKIIVGDGHRGGIEITDPFPTLQKAVARERSWVTAKQASILDEVLDQTTQDAIAAEYGPQMLIAMRFYNDAVRYGQSPDRSMTYALSEVKKMGRPVDQRKFLEVLNTYFQ